MIPGTNNILTSSLEVETQSSKNYYMDLQNGVINGSCDTIDAMTQVIYKILNTERYQNSIYSWNYGTEFSDLIGEPVLYVCAEVERRIVEALAQDDRIKSVSNFEFDTSKKHEVVCTFTVHTIFGDVESEKGVTY